MVTKPIEAPKELVELVKKEDFDLKRSEKTDPYVTDVIFCLRKAVYNRFFQKPTDIDKMCRMGRGIATEVYYLRKLPANSKQVRVANEYFVGRLDGVITRDGKQVGIEIKQTLFGSDVPADYYVDQCLLYSSMTGWVILLWIHNLVYNAKVPSETEPGKLISIRKTDHPSFHEVWYDEENEADKIFLQQMRDRSATLRDALVSKTLPSKCPRFSFECEYCDFKEMCEKDALPIEKKK